MPRYFEFEVSLREVKPRIWRRFLLREGATFQELHDAIQDGCGWQNEHLFAFRESGKPGQTIAAASDEEGIDDPQPDATRVKIATAFAPGDKKGCLYEYDFGDGWLHDVDVRQVVELHENFKRRLLDGARAFPPEDCGGVWGYDSCVRVARGDRSAEDFEDRQEWLGDWEPEQFDLARTKKVFDR